MDRYTVSAPAAIPGIPAVDARRILLYGRDHALQQARRLLLLRHGWLIDCVSQPEEFSRCVRSNMPYQAIVVCHSIAPADRRNIAASAEKGHWLARLDFASSREGSRQFLQRVNRLINR